MSDPQRTAFACHIATAAAMMIKLDVILRIGS